MWLSPIALDFWQILPSFTSLEIEVEINLLLVLDLKYCTIHC